MHEQNTTHHLSKPMTFANPSSSLAVLVVGFGDLAVNLLEHDGRRRGPRRGELQFEGAGGLDLALGLAQRVLELAGDRHLHLEQSRRVLLPELGLAGVAERHAPGVRARGQVVHHRLPGALLLALVRDLHALERLAVEAVRGLQRLVVLDADGPVGVADGQRQREVVRERRRGVVTSANRVSDASSTLTLTCRRGAPKMRMTMTTAAAIARPMTMARKMSQSLTLPQQSYQQPHMVAAPSAEFLLQM